MLKARKRTSRVLIPTPKEATIVAPECQDEVDTSATPIVIESIVSDPLELLEDEGSLSPPKGSKKSKGSIPEAVITSFENKDWIKPEVILEEMWTKFKQLGVKEDSFTLDFANAGNGVLQGATWVIPELKELKDQLNEVKSMLDTLPLDLWHAHTRKMNMSSLAVNYVKSYFNAEFGSQAWAKMFEILCAYQVLPTEIPDEIESTVRNEEQSRGGLKIPFDSVHLCEAPGAFISALNHFLKISYDPNDIDWNWLATTLSPYHEGNGVRQMINDDRLILTSMENWTFLEDSTGNILSEKNIRKLISQKREKLIKPRVAKGQKKSSSVLLVTADGSIDCQTNPAEQEAIVAGLQFAEIVAGLLLLQQGGSFVLKIFTFLEAPTICHLFLLTCAFREVFLFKPSTSKEGNSEVYVVCLGYLGGEITSFVENYLLPYVETYEQYLQQGKVLFPLDALPDVFIDRIKEAASFFCNYQMKIIKRNLSCFPCDARIYHVMKPVKKEAAEQWIEFTSITPLKGPDRLFTCADFPNDIIQSLLLPSCHLDPKKNIGSFAEKIQRQNGSDFAKLNFIRSQLPLNRKKGIWRSSVHQTLEVRCPVKTGGIEFEKPYDNIRSSRFCYGDILSDREELRKIARKYLDGLKEQGIDTLDGERVCNKHNEECVSQCMQQISDEVTANKSDVTVLCFHKVTWDFLTKTDFQLQQEDLKNAFNALKGLEKGKSMFFCRFPMLTRLHAGFVYSLAEVFEKVILIGDSEVDINGLFLFNFKGLNQPEHVLKKVEGIVEFLNSEEGSRFPVLQIIPMKNLLDVLPVEFILRYNTDLLAQDMDRVIGVCNYVVPNYEI